MTRPPSNADSRPSAEPSEPTSRSGRWKEPARLRGLPDLDLGRTRLERLVLFRTEPAKDMPIPGARREVSAYSKLAVFPVG